LTIKFTRHTAVSSCQLSAFSSQLVFATPACTLHYHAIFIALSFRAEHDFSRSERSCGVEGTCFSLAR